MAAWKKHKRKVRKEYSIEICACEVATPNYKGVDERIRCLCCNKLIKDYDSLNPYNEDI